MSNLRTSYFKDSVILAPMYQPYADAFSRGVHLDHGRLLKAFVLPSKLLEIIFLFTEKSEMIAC